MIRHLVSHQRRERQPHVLPRLGYRVEDAARDALRLGWKHGRDEQVGDGEDAVRADRVQEVGDERASPV